MRRLMCARSGQSTAEYAILFAIVIGAAIAMQQFIKTRLQGAIHDAAVNYQTAAGSTTFEPTRSTTSSSSADLVFGTALAGNVATGSNSNTLVTKGTD